jgi:RNA polymerase sigma-70 factor (ECF subfamily)
VAQIDPASAESPRPETIEGLFQALESSLLGYALRLLEDRALAEDVVQETFMKLQGQWDQVRERRPWLYRTVHNLALNQRRRDRKIVPLDPSDAAEGSPAPLELTDPQLRPDEQLARHEAVGLVRLTLETLEPRSRELVKLKFNDELSYQEISARTGLKVGHVGYLLHHALKAVAAELAKAGLVP